MARSGPVTQSPPAKISGTSVCIEPALMRRLPFLSRPMPGAASAGRFTYWPVAVMMVSAGKVNSEPSTGYGRLRPLASGSPRRISTALTASPSAVFSISTGAERRSSSTPSATASSISSRFAGISSRPLLYITVTDSAPSLSAVRAASMAVLPPPTTITERPGLRLLPVAVSRRNPMPLTTPSSSSPGMSRGDGAAAPTLRRSAS